MVSVTRTPPSSFTASAPGLLKEPARVRERLVNVSVIRKKRQVGHKERARLGPGDGLGVVEHVLHGHAHGVRQTHHHHTQGVSDQNHVHAGGVHQSGEGVIVRGDGRDLAWGVPVSVRPFGFETALGTARPRLPGFLPGENLRGGDLLCGGVHDIPPKKRNPGT